MSIHGFDYKFVTRMTKMNYGAENLFMEKSFLPTQIYYPFTPFEEARGKSIAVLKVNI